MCRGSSLVKFLDLGSQPLANAFLKEKNFGEEELRVPLEVYLCMQCNLAQLIHVVDPEVMFRDYIYFSAGMPKVSKHWDDYAEFVSSNFLSLPNQFVVEVGSNDGVLLECFKKRGHKVLGVDPAKNIAKLANERGIEMWAEFFVEDTGKSVMEKYGHARAILANNVFAHIDNHGDFMRGVDWLLANDGVLVIEAPYLLDMFKNLAYDTVYHEHLSYLAVRPMISFFAQYGFEIFDVELVKAQGTSLRLFIGRKGWHEIKQSVLERVTEETGWLDKKSSYQQLAYRIEKSRYLLRATLASIKSTGKKIAAYGAPAKGNTLLNYCGIGPDLIDYALEDLPSKQGFYTPGMFIPVVSREYASANPPDYYLLLAWNYKDAILEKEKGFIANGGKFIIPIGDDIKII